MRGRPALQVRRFLLTAAILFCAGIPAFGAASFSSARIGRASGCVFCGRSADAYIKEEREKFPGTWGWTLYCRVGGTKGRADRALLYFDLSVIPRTSVIRKAVLRLSVVQRRPGALRRRRFGAFLLQLPEEPGWKAAEVTAGQRRAGVSWPEGGILGCSSAEPVAVGRLVESRDGPAGRDGRLLMEFDLTKAVRAWASGKTRNCGIVIDNRLEGGAFDFYSSRYPDPHLRPYLEITLSPPLRLKPLNVKAGISLPPGDFWVEPMRRVHSRFKGKPGTLAQYGDSITVTMAFLALLSWGPKIAPKNCPPEVQREMDLITRYADRKLWRERKGARWGNTGGMMSDWFLANVDKWQQKMRPETAVVMFGTNDIGRIPPPAYTENMAAGLRRIMQYGTVPILSSIPPANKRGHREYRLAALNIAGQFKIPFIDYHAEILRRRPNDWNGALEKFKAYRGYQVPTLIARDGIHPSNPKQYVNDFSEEALRSNGYTLRNYLTLRKYYEVIVKVLQASRPM